MFKCTIKKHTGTCKYTCILHAHVYLHVHAYIAILYKNEHTTLYAMWAAKLN